MRHLRLAKPSSFTAAFRAGSQPAIPIPPASNNSIGSRSSSIIFSTTFTALETLLGMDQVQPPSEYGPLTIASKLHGQKLSSSARVRSFLVQSPAFADTKNDISVYSEIEDRDATEKGCVSIPIWGTLIATHCPLGARLSNRTDVLASSQVMVSSTQGPEVP